MAAYARGNPARWWKSRSCGSAGRAPSTLFISPFRRYIGSVILALFLAFFAGIWYVTNPTRISRLSESLLSKVLGGHVTVKSGHLSLTGTLLLSGVEVRTADPEPMPASDIPIISAEQIEVRFDWVSLLSGQLSATQLVAVSPVFRPIEDRETGHWNYERLRPPNESATQPGDMPRAMALPVVVVRNARVEWGEVRGRWGSANGSAAIVQTAETKIDGQLMPDGSLPSTYRFQFTQSIERPVEPPATGVGNSVPPINVAETRHDVGLVLTGTWDVGRNVFSATTENVAMSEALKRGMPRQAREWCEQHQLNGRLAQMKITFNPHEGLTLSVQFDGISMMWMVEPEQGIGMGEERPAYPLTVSNVHGNMVFSLNNGGMHINDLRGEVLGYQFVADCAVRGTSFDAPFDLNLRFPGAVLGERYPPLFMAFLSSQDLIQRVQPHGKMDIAISMRRLVTRGPMTFNGTVDCRDARIRFAHFPYPLEHLNGRFIFDQQSVTFQDVTATSDENVVHITGTTGTTWSNRVVDFLVTSDQTTFDDRLGACLPEKFQKIWESFQIRGRGGFVCRIKRTGEFFDLPSVTVDVTLEDAAGYMNVLPYAFAHAKGQLHFEGDQTRIDHITAFTGSDGSGRLTLDGIVRHPGGDLNVLQPELRVTADVPIEASLLQSLPEAIGEQLSALHVAGRVQFDGTVKRGLPKALPHPTAAASHLTVDAIAEGMQLAGTFKWTQGSMKAKAMGTVLDCREINAEAAVSPGVIDLKSFDGQLQLPAEEGVAGESLHINTRGQLNLATMDARLAIEAMARNLTLPTAAPDILPEDWGGTWKAFSPAGKMDLQATAALRITMPGNDVGPTQIKIESYDAALTLHGVTLKNARWPEPIDAIAGVLHVKPGLLEMQQMCARAGVIDLNWGGQIDMLTSRTTLQGDVVSHGIPTKWLGWVPEMLAQSLDTRLEGTVLSLHVRDLSREAPEKPWTFDVTMATQQLAVTAPLVMNASRANLVARGTFVPAVSASEDKKIPGHSAAFDLQGVIAVTDLAVTDHILDTVMARVDVISDTSAIHISEIDGKVAGGSLNGRVDIYTQAMPGTTLPATLPDHTTVISGGKGGYLAELTLKDADLARLVLPPKATQEDRNKIGTGHVAATLNVLETFAALGQPGERNGRGSFTVSDGNIYNVPLSMGLMQMATFRLPVARSFQSANMTYSILNDEIKFDRILFESQGMNLAGAGTILIKSKAMNLSFVTETPNEFFIPIISSIIRETRNELMQLSVTGTLDSPKVNAVPLSAIANTLKAILPHTEANAVPRRSMDN